MWNLSVENTVKYFVTEECNSGATIRSGSVPSWRDRTQVPSLDGTTPDHAFIACAPERLQRNEFYKVFFFHDE
jgi:hypothetical protein